MLDLKRLKTPARQLDPEVRAETSPTPARPAAPKDDPWHGRKTAPPPPGSDYGDFLEWATEGGPEWPGAVNLAVKLWMGMAPSRDADAADGPRP